jgi:hypothetical protein
MYSAFVAKFIENSKFKFSELYEFNNYSLQFVKTITVPCFPIHLLMSVSNSLLSQLPSILFLKYIKDPLNIILFF